MFPHSYAQLPHTDPLSYAVIARNKYYTGVTNSDYTMFIKWSPFGPHAATHGAVGEFVPPTLIITPPVKILNCLHYQSLITNQQQILL